MIDTGRPPYPHLYQINVSDGGVPKHPVLEAVIATSGVVGDRQENLKFHGGPDRALCLYSQELIEQLQDEGHAIEAGSSGENLTIAGLDWEFRDGDYKRVSHKKNPGWSRLYAKVLREGLVRPGDAVTVMKGTS
jgi:MOSC domain-containing protein YiiM